MAIFTEISKLIRKLAPKSAVEELDRKQERCLKILLRQWAETAYNENPPTFKVKPRLRSPSGTLESLLQSLENLSLPPVETKYGTKVPVNLKARPSPTCTDIALYFSTWVQADDKKFALLICHKVAMAWIQSGPMGPRAVLEDAVKYGYERMGHYIKQVEWEQVIEGVAYDEVVFLGTDPSNQPKSREPTPYATWKTNF